MKTIYKLVLKSYLGPMVLTFFIIMFVLMMNVLWRYIDELVGKGLDPGTIIELLCYATINMIPMALPLATLLAAIMTMGNLSIILLMVICSQSDYKYISPKLFTF